MNPRRVLLDLLDAALRAVDGRASVARALRGLHRPGPVGAFAIGKAASSMLSGARDVLGDRLVSALLITKDGHVDPALATMKNLTIMESAHPVPDDRSLLAGTALICALRALPADRLPLFLVSGGSSSLVESLAEGVSLTDLRELNRRGLGAGWSIAQLNAERARLSRLKGGGVARLLEARPALALLLSDVLTDDPDIIGSGLLGGYPGHRDRVERVVVAGVDDAVAAAREAAGHRGLDLQVLDGHIEGDVADVARVFLGALRRCKCDGVIWGGESTVTLPAEPGRGGRNQHLALLMATQLEPREALSILAAGTDGSDGPTEDAGAIVDAGTVERAELAGVDVARALRGCDSGLALEAAEDLVHTGPTGTNVGDILIGIKWNAARS
jgi:hydroxypyruvate reductase